MLPITFITKLNERYWQTSQAATIPQRVPISIIQEAGHRTYNLFSGLRPKLTLTELYTRGKTSFLPPHQVAHNLRFIAAEGKYLSPGNVLSTEYTFYYICFRNVLLSKAYYKRKEKEKGKQGKEIRFTFHTDLFKCLSSPSDGFHLSPNLPLLLIGQNAVKRPRIRRAIPWVSNLCLKTERYCVITQENTDTSWTIQLIFKHSSQKGSCRRERQLCVCCNYLHRIRSLQHNYLKLLFQKHIQSLYLFCSQLPPVTQLP